MTLTILQQGQHRSLMNLNGETIKVSLKGKLLQEMGNGLNINNSENNWTPGVHMPPSWGDIHIYCQNIYILL